MSPRFAVSLAIEIRANSDTISFRRVRLYVRAKCAPRRNVDYRNVCFPIERLSEPNDAFRTRVRAHTYNVWTVRATAWGVGGLIVCHWFCAALSINWLMIATYAKCTSLHSLHQGAFHKYVRIAAIFYSPNFRPNCASSGIPTNCKAIGDYMACTCIFKILIYPMLHYLPNGFLDFLKEIRNQKRSTLQTL